MDLSGHAHAVAVMGVTVEPPQLKVEVGSANVLVHV